MTLHRQRQLVRSETRAVVRDQDTRQPALIGLDLDPAGAGVYGVLHQLLGRAGRPLHHLSGGDAVDGLGRQQTDGHWGLWLAAFEAVRRPGA